MLNRLAQRRPSLNPSNFVSCSFEPLRNRCKIVVDNWPSLADTLDMTTTKLSKKAQQALAILKAGGTYETGLRRNYFGGETQMYWVESHPGVKVKGFGYITFRELDDAGLLKQDYDVNYGSTCHRRYYAA